MYHSGIWTDERFGAFLFLGKTAGNRLTNALGSYIITIRYITNAIWRNAHAGGETDFEG